MSHRTFAVRSRPFALGVLVCALVSLLFSTVYAAPIRAAGIDDYAWDFESDGLGEVPAGCQTPDGAAPVQVSDDRAHGGTQALRLSDESAETQSAVVCPTRMMDGADLRMQLRPDELEEGVLVSLLGSFVGRAESDVPVFHLWIKPDGSVWWFDGLVQDDLVGWTQVGAEGTVRMESWNTLSIEMSPDTNQAHVYVGDHALPLQSAYVGPMGPVGVSPVESVTGIQLASASSAGTGDDVFVDDLSIGDGRDVVPPDQGETFRVGDPTVIDESDGEMQMPNTATTIRDDHGRAEILVGYPVHGDATHATGTALAASSDHGHTWRNVDDRNPFPDEQSFYLSTLSNGDLLAVSYHTFMVEDSGQTKATVPTAVSSDSGRTWTHREGAMTAPERMRPISDGTSRPGHPLGGFVLVHSIEEAPDGTLYQSGYGYYEDDERYRQIVLASTDGGVNWDVRGTVAVDPDLSDHPRYEGFSEAGLARTADGDLLAVMRTGNYQPLYQSTSSDDGRTWSEPEPVVAGSDDIPVTGVFPDLLVMDNGTIVLWAGRPGQFLLASQDGNGENWTTPTAVDYLNSGNGTLVPLPGNRILTFGDRGADWTPNAPEIKGIWSRMVRVLD